MVQDADASDDLLLQLNSVLQATLDGVGGVTDDQRAVGNTIAVLHSDNLAIFEQNLVDVGVQHESSTVDSTDPGESFGDATQTVDRVDEGRVSISSHRVGVKLNFADHLDCGQSNEALIGVESNSMTNEVNGVWLQPKFLKHSL